MYVVNHCWPVGTESVRHVYTHLHCFSYQLDASILILDPFFMSIMSQTMLQITERTKTKIN